MNRYAPLLCATLLVFGASLPSVSQAQVQETPTYTMNNTPVSANRRVPQKIVINGAGVRSTKHTWRNWLKRQFTSSTMPTPANTLYYQNRDTGL